MNNLSKQTQSKLSSLPILSAYCTNLYCGHYA